MKNNENKEICTKCGGSCCRSIPGAYVPEDLFDHKATKEEILELLHTRPISIDKWDGDEESGWKDMHYLRPRTKFVGEEELEDNLLKMIPKMILDIFHVSATNDDDRMVDFAFIDDDYVCEHLGDNGCELSFDERPTNCKELIPDESKRCKVDGCPDGMLPKLYYALKWIDYNDILSELSMEILLKDLEDGLDEDDDDWEL